MPHVKGAHSHAGRRRTAGTIAGVSPGDHQPEVAHTTSSPAGAEAHLPMAIPRLPKVSSRSVADSERSAFSQCYSLSVSSSSRPTVQRPDLLNPSQVGSDPSNYLAAAQRLNAGHSLYGPLQPGGSASSRLPRGLSCTAPLTAADRGCLGARSRSFPGRFPWTCGGWGSSFSSRNSTVSFTLAGNRRKDRGPRGGAGSRRCARARSAVEAIRISGTTRPFRSPPFSAM